MSLSQRHLYAVKKAKRMRGIISYDPTYRAPLWHSTEEAKTKRRALLRIADLEKISPDETPLLTEEQEPDRAIDVLLASGVRFGIVTLGREGAAFGFLHGRARGPTFENAPDTHTPGAGEALLAAYLSRLLKEGSLGELSTARAAADIRFANAAATLCVGKRGAIPAMPFESQIDAFLAQARHEERADHSASVP
jgi:fructokinase